MVIAKDEQSLENLQAQFANRTVVKKYIALLHGMVKEKSGVIKLKIGRLPYNRMRFGVFAGGRDSETEYKVLSIKYRVSNNTKELYSLVEFSPKTGRTHQIRIHAKHLGNPVVTDTYYAG
ncbi:MAG: pseudouridine synthase, partial [Patescibacteria group bacterium]